MNENNIRAHIPLEGSCNARHLGGYDAGGRTTKDFVFFRTESPAGMTAADREKLYNLGVRTVLDLRGSWELADEPNPFSEMPGVKYYNVSLMDSSTPPHLTVHKSLAEQYVDMLNNRGFMFKECVERILEEEQGVLFHCSAGKDRTGVIAAILLLNAGVSKEMVIEEYLYSSILLKPWIDASREKFLNLLPPEQHGIIEDILTVKPEYINAFLDEMSAKYGDIKAYLKHIGLTDAQTKALADKVING